MACGSALTELALGKTISQAKEIKREQLVIAVGGLPSASAHAAHLAMDALSSALNQIAQKN